VCAVVLDCSHLLLVVAIGIAHAMLATKCSACNQCYALHHYVVEAHCYVTGSKQMNYLSSIHSTKAQIHQDAAETFWCI